MQNMNIKEKQDTHASNNEEVKAPAQQNFDTDIGDEVIENVNDDVEEDYVDDQHEDTGDEVNEDDNDDEEEDPTQEEDMFEGYFFFFL